jgi:23S rRNA (uridine2552-2'-O)-methyltransferase
LNPSAIQLPNVHTYVQDVQNLDAVKALMATHQIDKFDVMLSDLAPNTIGVKHVDAMRAMGIIEKTLPLYIDFLKPNGRFAIKIFM